MGKTAKQLEREISEAISSRTSRGSSHGSGRGIKFHDADIDEMFRRRGSTGDSAKVAILGDSMYVRRLRMPKWNIAPTVLDTVDVAIRHHNELGIPTSKHAHARRADYFRALLSRFKAEHDRLIGEAERVYGANGPIISGGMHEDWPSVVKDKIRFVAQGSGALSRAVHLHDALSKTRSPAFR